MLSRVLACAFSALVGTGALAQTQPLPEPSEAARALVGVWELSNPDRDRRCQLTFKLDPGRPAAP